jgi:voltage-gated potassium channel
VTGFSLRRFLWAQVAFAFVLAVGTVGFHAILDEGWVASFYRSVVTTTLTGLDTPPDTEAGKIFSVVVLLSGVAVFLYLAGAVVELITQSVFSDSRSERRRRREIDALEDHVIICGFGRVGRRVADEITAMGGRFVVVDVNEEPVGQAREMGALVVHGNGIDDEELERAGLGRARALVACSDSDESNLYITLSARAARKDLVIVARASNEQAARKLHLAGADRVVEPYSAAGRQMATQLLKPQVAAFLDVAGRAGSPELRFEEIEIPATCPQNGRALGDLGVREKTGAVVVAVRKTSGELVPTPPGDLVLDAADVVVAVGAPSQISALEEMFAPAPSAG